MTILQSYARFANLVEVKTRANKSANITSDINGKVTNPNSINSGSEQLTANGADEHGFIISNPN